MSQQFSLLSWTVALLAGLLISAVVARSTYAIALERARTAAALIRGYQLQDDRAALGTSLPLAAQASSTVHARGERLDFNVLLDTADLNRAPTPFEVEARDALRHSVGLEYVRVTGGHLLYAQRIVAGVDAVTSISPTSVRSGGAEVLGTLTVDVPMFESGHDALQFFGWPLLTALVAFLLAIAAAVWFVGHEFIAPIQRFCRRAERVSEADVANINAEALRFNDKVSNDELHRLDVAIKRLLRSIRIQRSF